MTDKNLTLWGGHYGVHLTDHGVWVITARNVYCYLLVGSKNAMLIDTGHGKGDLRRVVEDITPLPLIVANTHTHYDHSSGNGFWREVWAGPSGEKDAVRIRRLPHPDYRLHTLSDGQVFDLGERTVEAIAIGAHHPSSFAFLDIEGRSLIVGDEIDPGQVLLHVRGDAMDSREIIRLHLANMCKLRDMEARFDRLLPAHNGTPLSNDYIEDFIALSEGLLHHAVPPCPTVTGYGIPPFAWGGDRKLIRYRQGKASFICSKPSRTR